MTKQSKKELDQKHGLRKLVSVKTTLTICLLTLEKQALLHLLIAIKAQIFMAIRMVLNLLLLITLFALVALVALVVLLVLVMLVMLVMLVALVALKMML